MARKEMDSHDYASLLKERDDVKYGNPHRSSSEREEEVSSFVKRVKEDFSPSDWRDRLLRDL